jgi:ribonuclease III
LQHSHNASSVFGSIIRPCSSEKKLRAGIAANHSTLLCLCLTPRSKGRYRVGTTVDDLIRLQKALDITFHHPNLLRQALVHRSYLNESPDLPLSASNERMEFLGDAVLGMVIADELYGRFPEFPEGRLTEMRAQLVRGATLARIGKDLDLGSHLVLGRGEDSSGGRTRAVNLGRALEAIFGAVYLDSGLDTARRLIQRLIEPELERLDRTGLNLDPKSSLQQLAQASLGQTPEYVTVSSEGPDHEREFVVEVRLGTDVAGVGRGRSKRQAQQLAASHALESLSEARAAEAEPAAGGHSAHRSRVKG